MLSQSERDQIIKMISTETYLFGSKLVEADQGHLHLEYQTCRSRIMEDTGHLENVGPRSSQPRNSRFPLFYYPLQK